MNNQKNLKQVVDAAIEYLRALRYSEETVKEYKIAWSRIRNLPASGASTISRSNC